MTYIIPALLALIVVRDSVKKAKANMIITEFPGILDLAYMARNRAIWFNRIGKFLFQ